MRQETDVLDTWFSSGLWPFSTMGWPEQTTDLARYYPTSLLITAHDIIFFWVARMIMLGVKFAGDVPFGKVYITSLVRDEHGHKMSKSKGNVINPLELMEEIGADGFRFTLAALASPGMDISLSEGRLRGYRQFINKIWNASRFVLMNLPASLQQRSEVPPTARLELCHRWILHRVSELAAEVDDAFEAFRFDVAADRLFHFFWHEYADWYIELIKPHLQATGEIRDTAAAVLLEVHDRALRMLHPFIPFVTEEIWQKLPRQAEAGRTADGHHQTIALAQFPGKEPHWIDADGVARMRLLQELITAIRTVRAERAVQPSRKIRVVVEGADDHQHALFVDHGEYVRRLAGLDSVEFSAQVPRSPDTVIRIVRNVQVHIPLAGIVDRKAESARIERELAKLVRQRGALEGKLANAAFRTRANPEVVKETEVQAHNLGLRQEKLEKILQELGG